MNPTRLPSPSFRLCNDSSLPFSPLFIDHVDDQHLLISLIVLCFFIFLHIFASIQAPRLLSSHQSSFQINASDSNTSLDIDLTLSDLQNTHRFVNVNFTLVCRHPRERDTAFPIAFAARVLFSKNDTITNSLSFPERPHTLPFAAGATRGPPTNVLHQEVFDYDTVGIKLTISGNFSAINRLEFQWSFANPSPTKYARVVKLMLSVLHGYMLSIAISGLLLDRFSIVDALCIGLGVAGVFSSNPVGLLVPADLPPRYSEHLLIAGYVALLRFFILVQLETIRSRGKKPMVLMCLGCVVFGAYAMFDAIAGLDRTQLIYESESEIKTVLPSELLVRQMNIGWCVVLTMWVCFAVVQGRKYARKRLIVFAGVAIADLIATVFLEIVCVQKQLFAFTIVPEMVQISTHLTPGAFLIFFMRPEGNEMKRNVDGELLVDEMTSEDEPKEAFGGGEEEEEEAIE